MSIGFPTGDWCRSPSFSKTTPNMFKGRLNRGERFPAHNRGATYISATRLALFTARFMWEDGCWRVGQKKKNSFANISTIALMHERRRKVMVLHQQSRFSEIKTNLQTGSSIFMLRRMRIELGTVSSINWSIDCQKKKKKIRF